MKSLVLIKQHPCIQLGHLYEHLYLRRINQFFYEKGLFKFLDYAVHGATHDQGGIIMVDCDLYSSEAMALCDELEHLQIDYGPDNEFVTNSLYQLCAEEPFQLAIPNKRKLLAELERLDTETWQHIDELALLDTTTVRRKSAPVYLTNQEQTKPRSLHFSLILDASFAKEHRNLMPLFASIGRLLLLTVGDRVTAIYGVYAGGEIFGQARNSSIQSELFVTPSIASSIKLDSVTETTQETIKYVCFEETITRIASDLASTQYTLESHIAPNIEQLLGETNILIGSKGWQQIATAQNISKLLTHTSLEIKFGRQKRRSSL